MQFLPELWDQREKKISEFHRDKYNIYLEQLTKKETTLHQSAKVFELVDSSDSDESVDEMPL
jgi:hypothetical protein